MDSLIVDFKHTELFEKFNGEPFKLQLIYPGYIKPLHYDMPFEIENGVPIPEKQRRTMNPKRQEFIETLQRLQPGQSAFWETAPGEESRQQAILNQYVKKRCKHRLIISRTYKEEGQPRGVRYWRVE